MWTWGDNSHGQLGDGTLLSKKYPVQVLDEDGNPIKDIVRLAAGDDYVFAVDKNGKIYTWGVSISGGSDMASPVEVENTIGDEIEDIVSVQIMYLYLQLTAMYSLTVLITHKVNLAMML